VSIAIIDVDGVVADVRHRLHHLDGTRKDWSGFFAAAAGDTILDQGREIVTMLAAEHDIVWLTGRPEHLRKVTAGWLAAHDLPPGELLMRPERSYRPARTIKLEAVRRLAARARIEVILDDDPAVIDTLVKAGFPAVLADWVPRGVALDEAQESSGRT
jgi:hypothetical protein